MFYVLIFSAAGSGDGFLEVQLKPEAFQAACRDTHMQCCVVCSV
jgi:hypothetical protein